MDEPDDTDRPDDAAVARRAELLPEEAAAGSDDPEAQAEAILAESAERADRSAAPSTHLEERSSEEVAGAPVADD